MPNKRYVLLIYVVLTLPTFIAFGQVLHYEFINYDDFSYIVQNEYVKAGLTRTSIIWTFATGYVGNWHPLT